MPGETLLSTAAPVAAPPADPNAAAPVSPDPAPPAADPAAPKAEPVGAPEKYEAFTTPEGVSVDDEVSTEFQTLAKDLNLPQDAAQKVYDLGIKQAGKFSAVLAAKTAEMQAKWVGDTKADKEIGGEKLKENLAVASKAYKEFASDELSKLLDESRLGDHPEVVRLFYRLGKAMSEDKFVPGGKPAVSPTPYLSYPNSDHK